jgi:hypothetical protein
MIDGNEIEMFVLEAGHSGIGAFGDLDGEAAPVERALGQTA